MLYQKYVIIGQQTRIIRACSGNDLFESKEKEEFWAGYFTCRYTETPETGEHRFAVLFTDMKNGLYLMDLLSSSLMEGLAC